jgi:hypothetical protein
MNSDIHTEIAKIQDVLTADQMESLQYHVGLMNYPYETESNLVVRLLGFVKRGYSFEMSNDYATEIYVIHPDGKCVRTKWTAGPATINALGKVEA